MLFFSFDNKNTISYKVHKCMWSFIYFGVYLLLDNHKRDLKDVQTKTSKIQRFFFFNGSLIILKE